MIIGNAKVFLDGRFQEASVELAGDTIVAVGQLHKPWDVDAQGAYLVPGFVDIHTHGGVNEDFSDGKPEGLPKLSAYYAQRGVTSFLATTMTLSEELLMPAMEAVRDFVAPEDGASCDGIHLEGPFLSYAKRGAQAAEYLHKPDCAMFHRLNEASGGKVRLVTVAPEEPDAMAFIREISKTCTVSLGHTTADYDTAMAAYAAGATHATHLFNGMPAFGHRQPGVVGAAFDSNATVELICDGLHIHPSVVRTVSRLFGENLVVISDSLRCAGMPDGEYTLGGQPIEMRSGKATLANSDTLAGSTTDLLQEVKNLVSFGLPLEKAITAVTAAPARAAGLSHVGVIAPGKRADLLLLDSDLSLKQVYLRGKAL